MRFTITWHNAGPHTIWGQLAKRLRREPTNREAADEVRRILSEASIKRAAGFSRKRKAAA